MSACLPAGPQLADSVTTAAYQVEGSTTGDGRGPRTPKASYRWFAQLAHG